MHSAYRSVKPSDCTCSPPSAAGRACPLAASTRLRHGAAQAGPRRRAAQPASAAAPAAASQKEATKAVSLNPPPELVRPTAPRRKGSQSTDPQAATPQLLPEPVRPSAAASAAPVATAPAPASAPKATQAPAPQATLQSPPIGSVKPEASTTQAPQAEAPTTPPELATPPPRAASAAPAQPPVLTAAPIRPPQPPNSAKPHYGVVPEGPWLEQAGAERLMRSNKIILGKVTGVNRGGMILHLEDLGARAFLPYSALDRVKQALLKRESAQEFLISKVLKVIITDVMPEQRKISCSEIRARMAVMSFNLKVGDLVDGVVHKLHDRGAFISLKSPDGLIHGELGKVPLQELSWQYIRTPEAAVRVGQEVKCRVMGTEPSKCRIHLSLKVDESPLEQTLDELLPETAEPEVSVPVELPTAMEDVCSALKAEARITDITLGRQVEEKAVSQDLEVYIRRASAEGSGARGFDLVARAGRKVQEIHVETDLNADEMKQTIQDIVGRIL